MQAAAIEHDLPYPVLPFYLVALGDSVRSTAGAPIVRIGEPALDEGPHMSYAIQWFSFALIALAGAGYVTARSMQPEPRDWQATERVS
jgi:surfeit locus 1 family protein